MIGVGCAFRFGDRVRYRAKVDENQKEIVASFRAFGFSVQDLTRVGSGVPDLIIGYGGKTWPVEVVGPDKLLRFPPDGLSPNQVKWAEEWRGTTFSVKSVEEAEQLARVLRGV